ncbi:Methylated-DNA--protein-cysteine methyltransferase [hydrothermal vent metagenome]|uniref:Methylated-DNA--protein-cysteine methyltransferase n=1 Tax=hydrothermal vent metagenome TaxID=652676 RepID=A0A3B0ZZM3_9ZZZZ
MIYTDYLNTPIGVITIQASIQGIIRVDFSVAENHTAHHSELTDRCKQQLNEYFSGKRRIFDLPLDQRGTPFQRTVWDCLIQIPFGQVVSYANIADRINNRKAVRAVGAANGKNPIGIIVPCHRVIGSNGTLTGYAGGVERKAWLLTHEGAKFKS